MSPLVLRSKEDKSINFVTRTPDGGSIECRFAQRENDTIIIYLSSMTGCNLACRFCHLTQMGETTMTPVTVDEYLGQGIAHLEAASLEGRLDGVKIVHFNFMARGDVLSNLHFVEHTKEIIEGLDSLAAHYGLKAKFKISSIFPITFVFETLGTSLNEWVHSTLCLHPEIEFYYSIYSLQESFRKRWIPKAISPEIVGEVFKNTVMKLRLHHALIDGQNDTIMNVVEIGQWMERYNLHCHFNLVRYNSFDLTKSLEATEPVRNAYMVAMEKLSRIITARVITKIGKDVAASCGMFIK